MKSKKINEIELYQKLHQFLNTTSPETYLVIEITNFDGKSTRRKIVQIKDIVNFVLDIKNKNG